VKSAEEIMEILEAFDLTRSYRDAAELAGCDHHTVARYVAAREAGTLAADPATRAMVVDPWRAKLEEWVERSRGKLRADVAHDKLVALGYQGSERTTRRVVAAAKWAWRAGRRRVYRPWVPEPGRWLQWDYGSGPMVGGRATLLVCAWLAWSRFRVVLPIFDKALPSVVACLDTALRRFGGAPTYGLTDNEKTVTVEHVARIAVRNPEMVAAARHYGLTIATCLPADPETKGGSEAAVRIAKADLVPTEANLLDDYQRFADLERACQEFCDQVNARPHRVTRRAPTEALAEERTRLHPLPIQPFTLAFGQTRTVGSTTPMIDFQTGQYSVPHTLRGEVVWVREHGQEVVVVHVGPAGPVEVARHARTTPGSPRLDDAHFPPQPAGPLARTPQARSVAEAEFLAIGEGAALWLTEAGAAGTSRMRAKMAQAVALAKLHGAAQVSWALGHAAVHGRFADGDLAAILAHRASAAPGSAHRAGETASLQAGTAAWQGFGQ
jgi:hypothetical protein